MNVRRSLLLLSLLCIPALAATLACSKVSPTAPSGTTINLSASPGRISSATGTSAITAILVKSNGSPVNPGTVVHFDTNLGTLDPATAMTDSSGVARTTLSGDGRVGQATVHASTGSIAAVMVMVQIGSLGASLSLQATPSSIPESGGTVTLTALVRDDQGSPLANANVNFSTQLGTLQSHGALKQTGADGQVTDKLTVGAADISTLGANTFTVSAQTAGAMGALQTQMFTLNVQRKPVASFSFVIASGTRTVAFTDTSTPKPTSWKWTFGDGQTSTQENPVHTFPANPNKTTFFVTLEATNAVGSSSVTNQVVFSAGQ
jgi:PKD domain/Bacterial Ig-like domain (group 1)